MHLLNNLCIRTSVSGCIRKHPVACRPYRVPGASLCVLPISPWHRSVSPQLVPCTHTFHTYTVFFLPVIALIRKNLFVAIETQVKLVKVLNCGRDTYRKLLVSVSVTCRFRTGVSTRLATAGMFVRSYDLL
jgi:hypothetical protein